MSAAPRTSVLRTLCALALAGLAACAQFPSVPDCEAYRTTTWGEAGARTPAEVEELVETVEASLAIYSEVTGFQQCPVRVYFTDDVGYPHRAGVTIRESGGRVWVAVERGSEHRRLVLAHELAHVYFADYLAKFPAIVEEGICDQLALRVVDAADAGPDEVAFAMIAFLDPLRFAVEGPRSRALVSDLLEIDATYVDTLALDGDELLEQEAAYATACYGLGSLFAEAIGQQGLDDLVQRCDEEGLERIPDAWVLDAAGFQPPTQEALLRAFRKVRGYDEDGDGPPLVRLSDG